MLNSETLDQETLGRHSGKRYRIASLASNVFNPFLLSLGLIVLLSLRSSATVSEAMKWAAISVGTGILPVLVIILYMVKNGKLDDFFITAREKRTKLYIIGTLSTIAGCVILAVMNAPPMLIAGFVTAISTAIIFALINLWWKISLHTATAAASVTMLVIVYGWMVGWALALIPLTAWSRIELHCHSFNQAVSGAVLASGIAILMFQSLAVI